MVTRRVSEDEGSEATSFHSLFLAYASGYHALAIPLPTTKVAR